MPTNLSSPLFLLIPIMVKNKECFKMINFFEIAEIDDDGEVIRLKLRNGSPRCFSETERLIVIQQLREIHINYAWHLTH